MESYPWFPEHLAISQILEAECSPPVAPGPALGSCTAAGPARQLSAGGAQQLDRSVASLDAPSPALGALLPSGFWAGGIGGRDSRVPYCFPTEGLRFFGGMDGAAGVLAPGGAGPQFQSPCCAGGGVGGGGEGGLLDAGVPTGMPSVAGYDRGVGTSGCAQPSGRMMGGGGGASGFAQPSGRMISGGDGGWGEAGAAASSAPMVVSSSMSLDMLSEVEGGSQGGFDFKADQGNPSDLQFLDGLDFMGLERKDGWPLPASGELDDIFSRDFM